jgi:hypothetical protein
VNKDALAQKLWAAIDALGEADGFVLVATEDEITFTRLKAAGWNDAYLEQDVFAVAELRKEHDRLAGSNRILTKENDDLQVKIEAGQRLLDQLQAAVANALGQQGEAA